MPLLERAIFPFAIRGFHSDNGSEYINHRVAATLEKLHVEFTKSRPRRSNNNALVKSKNASVIRKHLGYCHIPARHAGLVDTFTQRHLASYINFHQPCFFATTFTDAKGKQRKRYDYDTMMTPYQKLQSLDHASRHLRPGITFDALDKTARAMTDS